MHNHLYKLKISLFFTAVLFFVSCTPETDQRESYVNFDHLMHLTEEIEFGDETVSIVHIYSEYPDYRYRAAAESGPEGITCVDDVGRAAVLYLRHNELTGDRESLNRARSMLKYILNMQKEDGQFYNFIFEDYSINKDGITSYPSFGWWAARGVWSIGLGYRIFKEHDPEFARELKEAFERTYPQFDKLLEPYGEYVAVNNRSVPAWLVYQYDTYSTATVSEMLLGLCEYYANSRDERVGEYIEKLAEAVVEMQEGDFETFPYGVFLSTPHEWHAWGNGQTQALAMAGQLLDRQDFIEAAALEVRSWYTRFLTQGHIRGFRVDDPDDVDVYQQIAYNYRPMIVGAMRLVKATGDETYEQIAGLLTSWFFGNNILETPTYDVSTGRCFDGINGPDDLNMNSGAESTIEALYAILEAEQSPVARDLFHVRTVDSGEFQSGYYAVFEKEDGERISLVLDIENQDVLLIDGDKIEEYI